MKHFLKHHINSWTIFVVTFVIYYLSNNHQFMNFNYYTYLANAFNHGRISVDNLPPWLTEYARINGHIYLRFGLAPALFLMPLVKIWGLRTNEALVSLTLGALTVTSMWHMLGKITQSIKIRLLGTMLFGFGTVFWFHATYGNSWYFAHVTTCLLLILAINETLKDQPKSWVVGLLLGLCVLARYTLLAAAPFFLILLWQKTKSWRPIVLFLFSLGLLLLFNGWYNYTRFGSVFETGYKIVEVQRHVLPFDPQKGLFNLSYFPFDAKIYLLKGPDWLGHFPWFEPNQLGMSLLLTTPALLYAFRAKFKDNLLVLLCWLSIILLALPSLFYFYVGWKEFGWRYSLDFMPFLIILIVLGFREKLDWLKITLISLSVLVNLWGVVYWRSKGW